MFKDQDINFLKTGWKLPQKSIARKSSKINLLVHGENYEKYEEKKQH